VPLVKENGTWKTVQGRDGSPKRVFEGNGTYKPLGPDEKANAIMKAETKSKRRATLSICGLGFLDETEIETIRDAATTPADVAHAPHPALSGQQQQQSTGFGSNVTGAMQQADAAGQKREEAQQQQPKRDPKQPQLERVRILNEIRSDFDKLGCQHQFEAIWNEYPWRVPSEVPKNAQSREMVQRLRAELAELRAKLEVTDADAITDDKDTWVPPANSKTPAQAQGALIEDPQYGD
jgi:hypothetical protein